MNIENRVVLKSAEADAGYHTYVYQDVGEDEINLADLVRKLAREWKAIALTMAIGILGSVAYALFSPKVYLVETIVRAPTVHELGEANTQNVIEIEPTEAFRRFVQIALNPETHKVTIESNGLLEDLSTDRNLTSSQVARQIYDDFSLNIVKHDYYELAKGEKTPLKDVALSVKSAEPELAVTYIQKLIENAERLTLLDFSADVSIVKENRIKAIQEQIDGLTQAQRYSREAEIARLEESNRETIAKLQQQFDLKIRKAVKDRENRIVQLQEAIKTANVLSIREPVTWDDLRPSRKSSQVTNEIGSKEGSAPLYFQGSRLLNAELERLKARNDDKPFIAGLADLENQIIQAQNDPRIAALKARANDTIYIEKLDELQRELAALMEQPIEFANTRFAVVSQPAAIPPDPIRNPMLYVVIGILVSGFVALMVALVLVSLRSSEDSKPRVAIAE